MEIHMKSLNIKLLLSAAAIAALATPAFAQRPHQAVQKEPLQTQDTVEGQAYLNGPALHYPDFSVADRSGSAESQESGAVFNLGR
jgi:hypothetical protein